MIDVAFAMGQQQQGGQAGGMDTLMGFLPMILIFAVFYFLLIRPQQKKAKEQKALLDNLKKGDSVITQGGLHGSITALTDTIISLEIADKVVVRVNRSHVAGLAGSPESITPQ